MQSLRGEGEREGMVYVEYVSIAASKDYADVLGGAHGVFTVMLA